CGALSHSADSRAWDRSTHRIPRRRPRLVRSNGRTVPGARPADDVPACLGGDLLARAAAPRAAPVSPLRPLGLSPLAGSYAVGKYTTYCVPALLIHKRE